MASSPTTDKRRQPRVRRKVRVAVEVRGRTFIAVTGNLSNSGLLLHTATIILPGTAISGALELLGRPVRFSAVVRWSRSHSRIGNTPEPHNSMGVTFLDPPGKTYLEFIAGAIGSGTELDSATAEASPTSRVELGRPQGSPGLASRSRAGSSVDLPAVAAPGLGSGQRATGSGIALVPPAPSEAQTQWFTGDEAPTAAARPLPGVQLVAGLAGSAEAVTRGSSSRPGVRSPLAPSAAATLVERASMQAVSGALPPGTQSVGLSLAVVLVQPPLVTLGSRLEATATLVEVVGSRRLRFRAEVREGDRLVATGDHERALVSGW